MSRRKMDIYEAWKRKAKLAYELAISGTVASVLEIVKLYKMKTILGMSIKDFCEKLIVSIYRKLNKVHDQRILYNGKNKRQQTVLLKDVLGILFSENPQVSSHPAIASFAQSIGITPEGILAHETEIDEATANSYMKLSNDFCNVPMNKSIAQSIEVFKKKFNVTFEDQ